MSETPTTGNNSTGAEQNPSEQLHDIGYTWKDLDPYPHDTVDADVVEVKLSRDADQHTGTVPVQTIIAHEIPGTAREVPDASSPGNETGYTSMKDRQAWTEFLDTLASTNGQYSQKLDEDYARLRAHAAKRSAEREEAAAAQAAESRKKGEQLIQAARARVDSARAAAANPDSGTDPSEASTGANGGHRPAPSPKDVPRRTPNGDPASPGPATTPDTDPAASDTGRPRGRHGAPSHSRPDRGDHAGRPDRGDRRDRPNDPLRNADKKALLGEKEAAYAPDDPLLLIRAVLDKVGDGKPTEEQAKFLHEAAHRVKRTPGKAHLVTQGSDEMWFEPDTVQLLGHKPQKGEDSITAGDADRLQPFFDLRPLGFENDHDVPEPPDPEEATNKLYRDAVEFDLHNDKTKKRVPVESGRGRRGEVIMVEVDAISPIINPNAASVKIMYKAARDPKYYAAVRERVAASEGDGSPEAEALRTVVDPPVPIRKRALAKPNFGDRPRDFGESEEDYPKNLAKERAAVDLDFRSQLDRIAASAMQLHGMLDTADMLRKADDGMRTPMAERRDHLFAYKQLHSRRINEDAQELARIMAVHPRNNDMVNQRVDKLAEAAGLTAPEGGYDITKQHLDLIQPKEDEYGRSQPLSLAENQFNYYAQVINTAREELLVADNFEHERGSVEDLEEASRPVYHEAFQHLLESGGISDEDDFELYADLVKREQYIRDLDAIIDRTDNRTVMYGELAEVRNAAFAGYLDARYNRELLLLATAGTSEGAAKKIYAGRYAPQYVLPGRSIQVEYGTGIAIGDDKSYQIYDEEVGGSLHYNADGSPWKAASPVADARELSGMRELGLDEAKLAFEKTVTTWLTDKTPLTERRARTLADQVYSVATKQIHEGNDTKEVWATRNTARFWACYFRANRPAEVGPPVTLLANGRPKAHSRMYGETGDWVLGADGSAAMYPPGTDDVTTHPALLNFDRYGNKVPAAAA